MCNRNICLDFDYDYDWVSKKKSDYDYDCLWIMLKKFGMIFIKYQKSLALKLKSDHFNFILNWIKSKIIHIKLLFY